MWRRLASAIALALLGPLAACEDTFIAVSSDGRILVVINTAGIDPDTDGFSISIDGGAEQFVASDGSVTLQDLTTGAHSVRLSGLAENCQVNGANPQSVVVGSDGTASLTFEVRCAKATTGGFLVLVTTIGDRPDTDGYELTVAGAPSRVIDDSARETFPDLTGGRHLVTLKDVDEPCQLVGGNPQPFTVLPGKTVTVRLNVECGAVAS